MNSATTVWPLSLRIAHWLNAALVIGASGLGAFMVLAVHDAATRFELTQTHKSIGVGVLVLTVLWLCLRSVMRAPKPEPAARSLAMIAKAVHVGLYILLLLLPLSGWLMVTSTPVRVPTVVFGSVRASLSAGFRHCALPLGACRAYCAGGCAYRAGRSPRGSGASSCLGLARPYARPYVVTGRLNVVIRVARNRGRPMTASTV